MDEFDDFDNGNENQFIISQNTNLNSIKNILFFGCILCNITFVLFTCFFIYEIFSFYITISYIGHQIMFDIQNITNSVYNIENYFKL